MDEHARAVLMFFGGLVASLFAERYKIYKNEKNAIQHVELISSTHDSVALGTMAWCVFV